MKYTVRVLLILVLSIGQLFAHNNSSDFQKEAITLLGGIAHIDDGTMIENSAIVLENGIIKACVDANKSRIPYKGEIIEKGSTKNVFYKPQKEYTKGLINSKPSLEKRLKRLPTVDDFIKQDFTPKVYTKSQREQFHQKLYQPLQ